MDKIIDKVEEGGIIMKNPNKKERLKKRKEVLIATLGSEPQVVTIALDELLKRGYPLSKVIVIYTKSSKVLDALRILDDEFLKEFYKMEFVKVPVKGYSRDGVIEDFLTEESVKALLSTIYKEIRELKQNDFTIHFLISGGRKIMGVVGMLVAQLLFGDEDRLWYLITEGWEPGNERKLHLSSEEKVWLVQIPVIRWSEASTLMRTVAEIGDPSEVEIWYRKLTKKAEFKRKKEFLNHWLTLAEREIVELVCKGYDNASISKILHKKEQTIANQLQVIYEKLKEWKDYPSMKVDRNLLIAEFAPYFALKDLEE
ncbi:CRISPR-associated protein Csx14 [Thermoanaerobacter kivui]|uniref:CRISPR-associated protein Csx14 n=1 Tax=Thermoanaerobacter kivui TaxID=2325 RepID=UPI000B29E1F9|nr:CRISPR-associated protein Csx14 [Thermoanaerobacter kivui]